MEKNINWNRIKYEPENSQLPKKRWGHKTIIIDHQIVLFGGFSDNVYHSDLWAYNIYTNRWRLVQTEGKWPEGKSNFTMHFDSISNQLILFGGGGPMKKRFNVVSILNWQTKIWQEYCFQDSNSPWQRTYHSSEFKHPYLITFGGQGAANIDFDDLWAFNIIQKKWKQIQTQQPTIQISSSGMTVKGNKKIQSRRFHSTSLLDNEFYVIGGCRTNYQCISSICSINLTAFFNSDHGSVEKQYKTKISSKQIKGNKQSLYSLSQQRLFWKQYKLLAQQVELIERWGHSSQAYQGKIYIFGGRSKDDLNNLIEFDPAKLTLKILESTQQKQKYSPKPRRRHSSCMIGSSMIIFGGFNSDYFDDMYYVSLFNRRQSLNLNRDDIKMNQENEVIWLEDQSFQHFIKQNSKEKTCYDVQICVGNQNSSTIKSFTFKSIKKCLRHNSAFFDNLFKSLNSQHLFVKKPTLSILLPCKISQTSLIIFNAYLMKQILILPQQQIFNEQMMLICELLFCCDYFVVKRLYDQIQTILIRKVLSRVDRQNVKVKNNQSLLEKSAKIDEIFNIAAFWRMQKLLSLCVELKVLNSSYYNPSSSLLSMNHQSTRMKQKQMQIVLNQIEFDELQRAKKDRKKEKSLTLNKNIKEINIIKQKNKTNQLEKGQNSSRVSIIKKVMNSLNKFYTNQTIGDSIQIIEGSESASNSTFRA